MRQGLNRMIYAVQKSRVIGRGMFTMYEIGEICFWRIFMCSFHVGYQKREIPVWLIAAGGILSASLGYFHGKIPLVLMVTGALVGGVFLLISRLTQEAFGYGDSLIIAVTGVYLGFLECVVSPCLGICSGSSVCRIRADQERFSKDAAFPFVPFCWLRI